VTTTTAACATACRQCATHTGYGREYEPGRYLALIHISHVGELEAQGWAVWPYGMYGDGTTDVVCPHLSPEVQ
jgi:hypothetical protein